MAEETASLNGEDEQTNQLKLCVLCATDLKEKTPKLLSCLHSLCENCLNSLFQLQVQQTAENPATENNNEKNEPKTSTILCPACNCKVERSSVMDNMFVSVETPIVIEEDEEEKGEEEPICAGCDENAKVKATSFCTDCREYLCDECVHAHKRVRITKDHTITPKEDVKKDDDSPDTSSQKMMYCQTHKHEPLKLFCETCDKLTCRDCQLLEHKDHKYQFLQEAITHQRENLQNAVVSLKNKLGNYKQANEILKSKHSELRTRMVDESQKIKKSYEKVVEQYKKYTDELVENLEKYVLNKTTIISEKQRLVADALLKMQHAVDFVENALTLGDDVSILYTKGAMVKNLKSLSESGIPFQPSFLNYSINYVNEIEALINNKNKLGSLHIDGVWYPAKHTPQPQPQVSSNPAVAQQLQRQPNRFPNSHMPISQAALNQQIREKIRHLPPEQQRIYEAKFREKYRLQQIQQQQAQQQAQHQAQQNRNQSNSLIQNQLNNHIMNRPQHQVPPPTSRPGPQPNQNNQFAMSAASHLAALSQRQSPQPPQYRHIAPAPGMKPNAYQQFNNISSVGGAQSGIPKVPISHVSREKSWNNCRMVTAEKVSSPGAQAAAYAIKTPSPAGAGFDHQSGGASQPATIDALQAWASQTSQTDNHQKFKQEYNDQRSSCAMKSSQSNLPTTVTTVSLPSTKAGPTYPPSTGKSMPQSKEEDPNEDWCAVCQNGGDLLCCDKCPKVFHLKCHVPELGQFPCGEWQCTLCKSEQDMVMKEKENKEISYIPGTKRKAPTGLTEHERRTCERILLELYTHEKSTVFHEPVSKAVPNYYKIITNPIDFTKVKIKLQRQNFNHYDTIEEFIADVKLIFHNCATYNSATSEIGIAGKMVEEEFERLIQKYLPCYMDVYDEILHRQSTSPLSDSDSSKSKKSKGYEHDPTVSMSLH